MSETGCAFGARCNYWRDIWEPMTRQHYDRGGVYWSVEAVDGKYRRVAALSVEEAMARRSGPVEIVYPEERG